MSCTPLLLTRPLLLRSWYQPDVDKPGPIAPRNGTSPTDSALQSMVKAAHQRGVKVLWRPCVDPHPMTDSSGKRVWRGDIGRRFTPDDWRTWFASYSPFIVRYAALAQDANVDQFSVGMELIQVAKQATYMRALCDQVRQKFHGSITYGANHGSELSVTWWDAVDVIGIDVSLSCGSANRRIHVTGILT